MPRRLDPDLYVNDYPVASQGVAFESIIGFDDAPSVADPTIPIYGRAGAILGARYSTLRSRVINGRGIVFGDTIADRQAKFQQFKARIMAGTVELRLAQEPTKLIRARAQDWKITPTQPMRVQPASYFDFTLNCYDPYRYSTQMSMVHANSFPQQIELGDAVVLPDLYVFTGGATNPTVIYRNASGQNIASFQLNITLGTNDWVYLDCTNKRIYKYVSGVYSEDNNLLLAGDFLTFDPLDGNYNLSTGGFPTLESSSGSIIAYYQKAWL